MSDARDVALTSGLFAPSWVRASSLRAYERCDGRSSRAEVNVSHMRRPETTDHSAQLPPPPKEDPPLFSLRARESAACRG